MVNIPASDPSAQAAPTACLYLYMVSASTSPNHTLSPAWKFSPCSSSVATSPPPLSWGCGWDQMQVTREWWWG